MTQVLKARAGKITEEMEAVALYEQVDVEFIRKGVAEGRIVIPRNINRKPFKYCGIGDGMRVKVNALIGTSSNRDDMAMEARKLQAAQDAGCDSFMDLSTGSSIDAMRKQTLEMANVAVGCTTIYQAGQEAIEKYGSVVEMRTKDILDNIEKQAAEGMDFMAIHSAFNNSVLNVMQKTGRVTWVVSRGGAFITGWMLHNKKENPLYEHYDHILEILKAHDVTLSLGDAIRPGATADSLDGAQLQGLLVQGDLTRRAQAAGVQVMVEGPGHVPLNHVEATMKLQKRLCSNAPYFILGTLATDVAPGYDNITGAIGGAFAGSCGADFLCYLTPAEHLGLPLEEDVRTGVITTKMAAQIADVARGHKQAIARENEMARARVALDIDRQIKVALAPDKLTAAKEKCCGQHLCTACGQDCAVQEAARYFGIA
ncbi:B12 lower ligand biosynthesis ThiC-like protein BzaB [Phosphitispora sp. TUW77]|uniref:B12 lower ligand biosynthesis ThiC-like protein BzaB n=1 Tax=Phosphitispora sp. TUW77 TaxID=3152361 RepID=UPI003AB1C648